MRLVVRRARAALTVGFAAAVTTVTTVTPALSASAVQPGPAARSHTAAWPPTDVMLFLAIHDGTSERGKVLARVTLVCGPDGGTHPHPKQACHVLDQADGRFEHLPAEDYACPLYHAPVTGVATGHWHGAPVHYTRTSTNRCVLARETSEVFAF